MVNAFLRPREDLRYRGGVFQGSGPLTSARPLADFSPAHVAQGIKLSRGRRNARPEGLIMRASSEVQFDHINSSSLFCLTELPLNLNALPLLKAVSRMLFWNMTI